jgi:hypothetical protein
MIIILNFPLASKEKFFPTSLTFASPTIPPSVILYPECFAQRSCSPS